MNVKIAEFG